jgi:hypothetical protein
MEAVWVRGAEVEDAGAVGLQTQRIAAQDWEGLFTALERQENYD